MQGGRGSEGGSGANIRNDRGWVRSDRGLIARRIIGDEDAVDKVVRFGETGGGHSRMFRVVKLHAMAYGSIELLGDGRVAHAELPHLRRNPGDQVLSNFALVGLAHPALTREFLQYSGPLAVGIRPPQRQPSPKPRSGHDQQQQKQEVDQAAPRRAAPRRGIGDFNVGHIGYTLRQRLLDLIAELRGNSELHQMLKRCHSAVLRSLANRAQGRRLMTHLGPTGFDMGCETSGAYRGAGYLVKLTCKLIVANEDNYALAA